MWWFSCFVSVLLRVSINIQRNESEAKRQYEYRCSSETHKKMFPIQGTLFMETLAHSG